MLTSLHGNTWGPLCTTGLKTESVILQSQAHLSNCWVTTAPQMWKVHLTADTGKGEERHDSDCDCSESSEVALGTRGQCMQRSPSLGEKRWS